MTFTQVGAQQCSIRLDGTLEFTGTLEGSASGTASALLFAPCEDALHPNNPLRTYPDNFKSTLVFDGIFDGQEAVSADMIYQGHTFVGGEIRATMKLSNGLKGILKVDAVVIQGGSNTGRIRLED